MTDFLTQIKNAKVWADLGDLVFKVNVEKTAQRRMNGSGFSPLPEFKQMNELLEHHKNDSADQLYPALLSLRSDVSKVAEMVKQMDQKIDYKINEVINNVYTNTVHLLNLQDGYLEEWTKNMMTELTEKCVKTMENSQAQIESSLNKIKLKTSQTDILEKAKISEAKNSDANIQNVATIPQKKPKVQSTLQPDARPFIMPSNQPKGSKKGKKDPPNAKQIPGSPEHAEEKLKQTKKTEDPNKKEDEQMKRKLKFSIEKDPNDPEEDVINSEYQDCKDDENDKDGWQQPKQSKSSKKKSRQRKKTDKNRAEAEVVLHGVKTTKYFNDLHFHQNEAIKVIEFLEEISVSNLGETDGFDVNFTHIVNSERIELWTGTDNQDQLYKPMVVQFIDIDTARAVMKAMKVAGYFKQRTLINRGKYRITGDKKIDEESERIVYEEKMGCYGRKSSTKEERVAYRQKKEAKNSHEYKDMMKFNERKQNRRVDYSKISTKLTVVRKDGRITFADKTENENEFFDQAEAAKIAENERISALEDEKRKADLMAKEVAEIDRISALSEDQRKAENLVKEAAKKESNDLEKSMAENDYQSKFPPLPAGEAAAALLAKRNEKLRANLKNLAPNSNLSINKNETLDEESTQAVFEEHCRNYPVISDLEKTIITVPETEMPEMSEINAPTLKNESDVTLCGGDIPKSESQTNPDSNVFSTTLQFDPSDYPSPSKSDEDSEEADIKNTAFTDTSSEKDRSVDDGSTDDSEDEASGDSESVDEDEQEEELDNKKRYEIPSQFSHETEQKTMKKSIKTPRTPEHLLGSRSAAPQNNQEKSCA